MTDNETADTLERIARLYLAHGQPDAAAKLLAAASTLAPGSASILRLRTLAAFRTGSYGEALALSKASLGGTRPSGQRALKVLEALSLMRLGQPIEARERFQSISTSERMVETAQPILPLEAPEAS